MHGNMHDDSVQTSVAVSQGQRMLNSNQPQWHGNYWPTMLGISLDDATMQTSKSLLKAAALGPDAVASHVSISGH